MKRAIEEIEAGNSFRDDMVAKADILDPYPAWRGWVIMDSFLAGIDWARAQHSSDCATHNAPAYPSGPCDCRNDVDTAF